jgi:hypothetical protein
MSGLITAITVFLLAAAELMRRKAKRKRESERPRVAPPERPEEHETGRIRPPIKKHKSTGRPFDTDPCPSDEEER